MNQNFAQFDDLRLMYGFEDISFASLGNSEIQHIFNDVVDKTANNAFVFQKKKSIPNTHWNRRRPNLKLRADQNYIISQLMF